jgi:hypothetical protein
VLATKSTETGRNRGMVEGLDIGMLEMVSSHILLEAPSDCSNQVCVGNHCCRAIRVDVVLGNVDTRKILNITLIFVQESGQKHLQHQSTQIPASLQKICALIPDFLGGFPMSSLLC